MNRGVMEAKKIISDFNIDKPNKYSISDIICGLNGPLVKDEPMTDAEGRLVCTNNYSLITINSNIKSEGKKRFTIAHELGHYEMHRDKNSVFNCDDNNLMDWNEAKSKSKEVEANNFAAELLLPEELFFKYSRKEKFSIDFINHLSDEFCTSITATSLRFAEKGNDPILLVCSQNGIIRWFKRNDKFPYSTVTPGKEVPANSVIAEYYKNGKQYSRPEEINPVDWSIKHFYNDLHCFEQCVVFEKYGYALSYIIISKIN